MSLRIDRCMCFGTAFATLAEAAEATGAATVAELQRHALFGERCGLCHPYVRRMLRTGETAFGEIVTADDEPATPPRPGGGIAPQDPASAAPGVAGGRR